MNKPFNTQLLAHLGQRSVVVAGEYWHGATAAGLARGLRRLGWLVADIDLDDYLIGSRALGGRLLNRTFGPFSSARYTDQIISLAQRTGSDLFIATKGSFVTAAGLQSLGRDGVFRVNYFPDVSFDHPGFSQARLAYYDLIVTTKTFHLDHLRGCFGADRVAFVPHGYSPAVHRRRQPALSEGEYEYDICYIGSASESKLAWLADLPDRFPDKRIAVAGAYWATVARGTPLERCFVGHSVTGDYYARMLELSRINIALHFGSVSQRGWSDAVSTRTFEIPACGGFMLHIDNDEVRALFRVPEEIDVFATKEELYAKIDFYLDRSELRRTMIEAAHHRAVPAYSLDSRAKEIAALIPPSPWSGR